MRAVLSVLFFNCSAASFARSDVSTTSSFTVPFGSVVRVIDVLEMISPSAARTSNTISSLVGVGSGFGYGPGFDGAFTI
ncbi:hypothetical protein D3C73_1355260 [compost metagenome]